MSIIPVSATAASPATWDLGATSATAPTAPTSGTTATGGPNTTSDSFANLLGNALDGVQTTQANADSLATQAASGTVTNVADYMVAAEEANIQTQLTSAVRNNALQAFQQIMGMQL